MTSLRVDGVSVAYGGVLAVFDDHGPPTRG